MQTILSTFTYTTFLYYGFITFIILRLISLTITSIKAWSLSSHWATIAKKKRTLRDQQIKDIVLPKLDISPILKENIINSDATGLLKMLQKRDATSEQMLVVYFERTITIGLELELVTELNWTEALTRAREFDKLRRENPSACKGTLFGLPMTIKDTLVLKGTDTSGGMACRLFNPEPEDGLLVKALKAEGALIFAKSNVPQAIVFNDSENRIWGRAKNPWNKERSCGGSTGGEAGLLAARCTPLGLGNDHGGSIRIPAGSCGVVGFKPCSERVTRAGTIKLENTVDAFMNIRLATGPLARSVRDVNLLMKALLNSDAYNKVRLSERDPHYVRQEWQESKVSGRAKNLRIGYFKNIEFFTASQASQRAVEESVQHLKNKGYELVEVEFPNINDIQLFFLETLNAEGNSKFLSDSLRGEKTIPGFTSFKVVSSIPNWIRPFLKVLLNFLGEKRAAIILTRAQKKDAYEQLQMMNRQAAAMKKFFKVWEENKLDGLLSPDLPHPAQKIQHSAGVLPLIAYICIFNLLNMPSGSLPITVVKKGEDNYPKELTPYHDMMYKAVAETMEGSEGMPISVQISTLPNEEEKCVGIMLDLEEEAQFVKKHPYPV